MIGYKFHLCNDVRELWCENIVEQKFSHVFPSNVKKLVSIDTPTYCRLRTVCVDRTVHVPFSDVMLLLLASINQDVRVETSS